MIIWGLPPPPSATSAMTLRPYTTSSAVAVMMLVVLLMVLPSYAQGVIGNDISGMVECWGCIL